MIVIPVCVIACGFFLRFTNTSIYTMTSNLYLQKWQQVPPAVKQFLLKGLLLLVAWKIVYLSFLLPYRILDEPLTNAVGKLTASGLNLVTASKDFYSKYELGRELDIDVNAESVMQQSIYYHQTKLAGVYDSCNALELMVLYAGFIICVPAALNKKFSYISGGLALIFAMNVIRCIIVAYMIKYAPTHAEFVHHYVLEFVVYALIIGLWLLFANNIKPQPDGDK